MSRRIEQDGKFFRMRRGKLVQIPPEWVGVIPKHRWGGTRRKFWRRLERRRARRFSKNDLRKELSLWFD